MIMRRSVEHTGMLCRDLAGMPCRDDFSGATERRGSTRLGWLLSSGRLSTTIETQMVRKRKVVPILLVVLALIVLAFALGPRVPVDTTITFDPKIIGPDPEAYLARREAEVKDIRPGLQK